MPIMEILPDAHAIFRALDADGDGKLTRNEILAGFRRLGLPTQAADVNRMMAAADLNRDGTIDFREFVEFVDNRETALRATFAEFDRDGNGYIDYGELRASIKKLGIACAEGDLRRMMARVDRNADQKVTFDEFRFFFLTCPATSVSGVFEYWAQHAYLDNTDSIPIPELDDAKRPAWWRYLAAGGIAGVVSRTATAPLDRIKVVMQVSGSGSVGRAIQHIAREGGAVRAFWKGNGVNVIKIAPESAIKFAAYERFKALVAKDPNHLHPGERCVAGAMAGIVSQASVYPLDMVKTRLMTAPQGTYRGLLDALVTIAKTEGPMVLYRGLGTAMVGVAPYAGTDLMIYETLKTALSQRLTDKGQEPGVLLMLACGTVSSTCGATATYPLALVRTRLQAQGVGGQPVLYNGMLDAFRKIARDEGVGAFYRGMGPNLAKVIPAVSLSYVTYEKAKDWLQL